MFSNFIQVLRSSREFYTMNQYFSNLKLFSTNSLLQKQRLNSINYSKQELIMEIFYELLIMMGTFMQKFRTLSSMYICK
jgi:hypothetical protein